MNHNLDGQPTSNWGSGFWIGGSALVSGVGWYVLGLIAEPADPATKIIHAFAKTFLTLIPAFVAYMVAAANQRRVEAEMAQRVTTIRVLFSKYVRLQAIQNELDSVDRLAKVARSATIQTGSTANELFQAIEAVKDDSAREMLIERYRYHTSSFVGVLNAINEQLSESGKIISEQVTADEEINIIDRADKNAADGMAYAEKIIQNRGIGDGVKVLTATIDRAKQVQGAIASTVKKMQPPAISEEK